MNELKIFNNSEFGEIRTIELNGEPWFVGNDVAKALGYKKPANAVSTKVENEDTLKQGVLDSNGKTQNTTIINESGLYSLIFGSDLGKAQRFKKWVTSEVLPSIRKHGAYLTPETLEKTIQDPDYLIGILNNLKNLQVSNQELQEQVKLDKPKVIFADAVASSGKTILIRQLAKILKQNGYNVGEKRLFEQLRQDGYLIKRNGDDKNTPTQKAMDLDLFRVKESTIARSDGQISISFTTKVTGKGQAYFVNKYANNTQIML